MKPFSLSSLFLIIVFAVVGCTLISPTKPSTTAPTIPASILTARISATEPSTPTEMVRLPSDTPSPDITLTPIDTLEPVQVKETLQPLIKEPMNCAVPCFWGIIPGKTHLDEVKILFNHLGFTPREGKDFYSIAYKSDSGSGFSLIFYTSNNFIENIEVTQYITKQEEGSPREWIAYSPETLIKRYGSPSSVRFVVSSVGLVGSVPNIGVNMIMYFDTSDLIVEYSGNNMTPKRFCPSTAPFDFVRLWMGPNPPDTPSFETVPLEKATSLTMEQFTQLMIGDSKKACFTVNGNSFQ